MMSTTRSAPACCDVTLNMWSCSTTLASIMDGSLARTAILDSLSGATATFPGVSQIVPLPPDFMPFVQTRAATASASPGISSEQGFVQLPYTITPLGRYVRLSFGENDGPPHCAG